MTTATVTSPSGKTLYHRATRTTTPKESSEAKTVRIERNKKIRLEENRAYLMEKNVKAFLDTIAETEGGDYDLKYGGVKGKKNDKWRISDYSTHPGPGVGGHTTASGRYQINNANWQQNGVAAMGLTDFSPETQDLIAVEGLRSPHNAIDFIVSGNMAEALKIACRTWESLPQGKGLSNRPIGGKPSNQPYTEYSEVIAIFKKYGGVVTKE